MLTEKKRDRSVEWVRELGFNDGFSEDELSVLTLSDVTKYTVSAKFKRLFTIAYYRGMGRGVKTAWESVQPVNFPEIKKWPEPGKKKDRCEQLLCEVREIANQVAALTEYELHNWSLDGFNKLTQSRRTLYSSRLFYYRGWIKGIHFAWEREHQRG